MICCGDMKVFILLTCLTVLSTCELVGDSTVDGKGNKEEKTREVSDIGCITKVKIFIN